MRRNSISLDVTDRILALAQTQFGMVARRQLLGTGMKPAMIDERVATSRLFVVYPGVYAVGRPVDSKRAAWQAGILAAGPGSCLCRLSAAELWGFGKTTDLVQVLRGFSRRPGDCQPRNVDRSSQRLRVHRTRFLPDGDVTWRNGFPVTSVARTLHDQAAILDLSKLRLNFVEAGRLGLIDIEQLRSVADRGRGWRGSKRLQLLVDDWDPRMARTKSELERRFFSLCAENGVRRPAVNVKVAGIEADCFWADARLIVELDSWSYHGDRVAFDRDHRRDFIHREADFEVFRITHEMLDEDADALVASLRRSLRV